MTPNCKKCSWKSQLKVKSDNASFRLFFSLFSQKNYFLISLLTNFFAFVVGHFCSFLVGRDWEGKRTARWKGSVFDVSYISLISHQEQHLSLTCYSVWHQSYEDDESTHIHLLNFVDIELTYFGMINCRLWTMKLPWLLNCQLPRRFLLKRRRRYLIRVSFKNIFLRMRSQVFICLFLHFSNYWKYSYNSLFFLYFISVWHQIFSAPANLSPVF